MPDSSLDPRNLIAHPSPNWKERTCPTCGVQFEGRVFVCPTCSGARERRKPGPRPSPIFGRPLGARERELVALLAEDLLDKEIAERMGTTPGTVKEYLCRIRKKLGARTRVGVAVWYVRLMQSGSEQNTAL